MAIIPDALGFWWVETGDLRWRRMRSDMEDLDMLGGFSVGSDDWQKMRYLCCDIYGDIVCGWGQGSVEKQISNGRAM